jgi:hypothetical protein
MGATNLIESAWKDLVRDHKVKDNGLQRVLAAYQKLGDDYEAKEKALAQVIDLAAKLARDKVCAAIDDVAEYLDDLKTEAGKARTEVAQLKKSAEKTEAEQATQDDTGKPPDAHTSRSSFVAPQVKENAVATKIINQIYSYFPKKYTVISAYLTAGDLYWKVNYHWDAMRVWLEYAKDNAELSEEEQKQLNVYYATLMSNPPSQTGHFKVNKIGEPADSSSESTIEQRCRTLQTLKAELKNYSQKQDFVSKKLAQKSVLEYALNPLALPKQSNHIHGWALDIKGDIPGAAKIAKSLGATLAFQEMTHCHCEFKSGVKLPG